MAKHKFIKANHKQTVQLTDEQMALVERAQSQELKARVVRDLIGLYELVKQASDLAVNNPQLLDHKQYLAAVVASKTLELVDPVVEQLKKAGEAETQPEPSRLIL